MSNITQLSALELQAFLNENPDAIILDVREEDEIALCSLPGHIHIPMNAIPLRHNELPDNRPIVLYCHHGIRSLQCAMYLENIGFEQLYNLKGGIDAWSLNVDSSVKRY